MAQDRSRTPGAAGEPHEDTRFATGRDHPSESEHDHKRNRLKGESHRRLEKAAQDPDAPKPGAGAENGEFSTVRTGRPHNG